ncbi:MAG: efflux RND transporter periplasmic adaptor subunit [Candidatus Cyclobacteriaceae bacterium M3_2C_046]
MEAVHFSEEQFAALDMKTGTLKRMNLSSAVEANGQLEVPPQNEANVTAIIGANISSIKVIEGDQVHRGQALAYVSHPDLVRLQTDYINAWNRLQFLEEDYQRQKRLYEEEVASGKEFQRVRAEYQSMRGQATGYEAQLKLMGLNITRLKEGNLYEWVPVASPIDGYIQSVQVKTGQFVQPEQVMFEVVNTDHIHADLMVFEKDVYKVKEGQKVNFSVETLPEKEMTAVIYAVGKTFEQDPKAVHIHAEIENKEGQLLPGMYVKGRILTDSIESLALPEQAIVREGERFFAFTAEKEDGGEWMFIPVEVAPGVTSGGWTAVNLLQPVPENQEFALNNGYYLIAEMNKAEAGHSH